MIKQINSNQICMSKNFNLISIKRNESLLDTIVIGVNGGPHYEDIHNNGITHFLEHIFFRGSKKLKSRLRLYNQIESLGGRIGGITKREITLFYIQGLKKSFAIFIDILLDLFYNMSFRDIDYEKKIIITELNTRENLLQKAFQALLKYYFENNNNSFPVLGNINTINSFNIDILKLWHSKFYKNINETCLCINRDENSKYKYINNLLYEYDLYQLHQINQNTKKQYKSGPKLIIDYNINKYAYICIGFISNFKKSELKTLQLLNTIIGGCSSSIIPIKLRNRYAYNTFSKIANYKYWSILTIIMEIEVENINKCLDITFKSLYKLKTNELSNNKLNTISNIFESSALQYYGDDLNLSISITEDFLKYNISSESEILNCDTTKSNITMLANKLLIKENMCMYINGNVHHEHIDKFISLL